ncbi:TetR/AcrR family transcriptional regulator [Pseudothauera rhizosphaerae]|nr:TetR/AcrR family transcriptional regulator [Pseudothauera rhizosphaerae]
MESRTVVREEGKRSSFELRRDQILCAARACFSENGFHGTSIADLSQLSGMSSGHIYHYFQSKEAIVEAIAESTLMEILEVHGEIINRPDVLDGLISHAVETSIQFSRLENSRLRLEILSEAPRNVRLARIVQDFDRRARESTFSILKSINRSTGTCASDAELEARFEILGALVSGFLVRSVKGGRIEEDVLRQSLRRVFFLILMPDFKAHIDCWTDNQ